MHNLSPGVRIALLPLLAVAGLILAIGFVVSSLPADVRANPPFAPPQTSLTERIAAVGLIEAGSENIAIAPALPGLVMAVHVEAGERVARGAPLFSLDTRDREAERAVAEQALTLAEAERERLRQAPRAEALPALEARVAEAVQRLADAQVQLELLESVDDPRAVRREDRLRRGIEVKRAQATLAAARADLALVAAGSWSADLAVAEASVALARARLAAVAVAIERLTVRAPREGVVLRVDVRVGEFADASRRDTPLLTFGDAGILHVRTEIDEYEAHRLMAGAAAEASPRGHAQRRLPLEFVRSEPHVIPRRQLTGDVTQRVDTRVLQVIYRLTGDTTGLRIGQQMDVFIEAGAAATTLGGGDLVQE